jgi:hypothetical protein
MDWNIIIILILLVVNFPIYRFLHGLIFSSLEDSDESLRYSLTPNIISFFRGEYLEDKIGTMRLSFYLFLCAIPIFLEYKIIDWIIGYFTA